MAKKKKEDIEEEIIEDDKEEEIEELYDDDSNEEIIKDDEEVIDSSLEIGGQIHQQSDVVKKFYHLPKDVKYSKFGQIDMANFTLKSKAYDLFQYVRKIQSMTANELEIIREQKKEFYDIETLEELKEFLKESGKLYVWENLRQLSDEDLKQSWDMLKQQLQEAKDSGFIEVIYGDKENFKLSYNNHIENYSRENNLVDDFGLLSSMMTLTEVKKAAKGWATGQMNTTISVTRNEDLTREVEEEPEEQENKMRSFFKK